MNLKDILPFFVTHILHYFGNSIRENDLYTQLKDLTLGYFEQTLIQYFKLIVKGNIQPNYKSNFNIRTYGIN